MCMTLCPPFDFEVYFSFRAHSIRSGGFYFNDANLEEASVQESRLASIVSRHRGIPIKSLKF